ncbi:hypothetical protein F2Q69_00027426 [Brassica cretica]|uniref:Uncharacterized protein n=1 Tax=Brassica cretica TaxID=69181 RepID=A0A8S9RTB1_BRACR|nr:hypothetical protein F2Q69_00027426 [Brassica cretica]
MVDRSCSRLIVGRLIDHMSRTVRGCYRGGIRASGRISRPNPNPKRKRRDRYRELAVVWNGHMVRNNTSFGKDFIISWEDEDREGFEESGQG